MRPPPRTRPHEPERQKAGQHPRARSNTASSAQSTTSANADERVGGVTSPPKGRRQQLSDDQEVAGAGSDDGQTFPDADAVNLVRARAASAVLGNRKVDSTSVSTGFAARLDERTRAQRRRRWIRLSSIGLVVAVMLTLAWLAFLSPVFRLDANQVQISGQGTVIAPGAVEKVTAEEVGTPLTLMDTVGLRNRILEVPGVRDAVLTRKWPDGLSIELVAREPVAAVPDGSTFTLRDDLGDVVGRAKKVPKGLPVIKVPGGADTARTLEAAIFMLNAIPADLHQEIKSVSATTPDAVTMKLRDGATVLWGNQTDAELKVRVFEVLRSAKETKDARVFDVSAPNAPITR